jgi:hypothetical protein
MQEFGKLGYPAALRYQPPMPVWNLRPQMARRHARQGGERYTIGCIETAPHS